MNKVAFIYDFDKTLSPLDMQEYGLLKEIGYQRPRVFWDKVDRIAKEHDMDRILAYMYQMIEEAKEKGITINKQYLFDHGKNIELFDGVQTWFQAITSYGKKLGLEVEHYIVSSGLKQMILGTSIAGEFKHVFASEFMYDENNNIVWPSQAINYTMKTQYLFRINKGLFDLTDDLTLNQSIPHYKRPIPFEQMIYIGDGLTDVASMSVIRDHHGYAFAVYDPISEKSAESARALKDERRVDEIFEADYQWHATLYTYMCNHLDKIARKIA